MTHPIVLQVLLMSKQKFSFSIWSINMNATFVLMFAKTKEQPDGSPCSIIRTDKRCVRCRFLYNMRPPSRSCRNLPDLEVAAVDRWTSSPIAIGKVRRNKKDGKRGEETEWKWKSGTREIPPSSSSGDLVWLADWSLNFTPLDSLDPDQPEFEIQQPIYQPREILWYLPWRSAILGATNQVYTQTT